MHKVDRKHRVLALLVVAFFLAGLIPLATPSAHALNLGGGLVVDLIKIFGIGWAVTQFGGEINNTINSFLGQRNLGTQGMTKVVPIVSIGSGTAVGAAQVVGPDVQVRTVRAVAQLEWVPGDFRGRYLIPVTTDRNLTSSVTGVDGVGISALVDFPI